MVPIESSISYLRKVFAFLHLILWFSNILTGDILFRPSILSEKAMAPPLQYSCLENPWMEESDRLQSMGWLRVGHD